MKTTLRVISIIFGGLLVSILLGVALVNFITENKYKQWVSNAVYSATGRELTIDGMFDLHLGNGFRLEVEDISLAGPQWGSEKEMVQVDRLFVALRFPPLIRGVVDVTLEVEGPDIFVEYNEAGQSNWDFQGEQPELAESLVEEYSETIVEEQVVPENQQESGFSLPFKPYIRNLQITDLLFRQAGQEAGGERLVELEQLRLHLEDGSLPLECLGKYQGAPFELRGSLGQLIAYHENAETPISLRGTIGEAELQLEGTVGPLFPSINSLLNLSLQVEELKTLEVFAGVTLPELSNLDLQTKVAATSGNISMEEALLNIDDTAALAKITAKIDDLLLMKGMQIDTDLSTSQLSALLEKLGVELAQPLPPEINIKASIKGDLERLTAEPVNVEVEDDGVRLGLAGSVENLITVSGVKATVTALVDDSSRLTKYAGVEIPSLGQLELKALLAKAEDTLVLENGNLELAGEFLQMKLEAAMDDLLAQKGVQLGLSAELDNLASLSSLVGSDFPETGPWSVKGNAQADDIQKGKLTAQVDLKGEETETAFEVTFPEGILQQSLTATLASRSDSTAFFEKLLGRTFPIDGGYSVETEVSISEGAYRLNDLDVRLDDATLTADLVYSEPTGDSGRKQIKGTIQLENFDTTLFQQGDDSADEEEPAEPASSPDEQLEIDSQEIAQTGDTEEVAANQTAAKKVFPTTPLSVGFLHEIDIDLQVQAADLILKEGAVIDGELKAVLDGGLLEVSPLNFTGKDAGKGTGKVILDARDPQAKLVADLNFDELVLPAVGGKLDLDVDLDGSGDSVASLMAGLNGHFITSITNVPLKKSFVTQLGSGMISRINPMAGNKTTLECGVIRLEIQDGMVDFEDKMAFQTNQVTWFGGGEIDLKTEKMDMGFASKARGTLSSLTDVGLASLVRVSGTLADPSVGIDTMDVAKKYLSYSAFLATGGLSFLAQKTYDNIDANVNQCKRILKDLQSPELQPSEEKQPE